MTVGTSQRTSACSGSACACVHVGHIPPIFSCAGWLAWTFPAHVVAVTEAGTSCPKFHWPAIKSLLFRFQEMTGLTPVKGDTVLKGTSHLSLSANSKCQIMCSVVGGISIITHSEANNYKVYLSATASSASTLLWCPGPGWNSAGTKFLQLSRWCCPPSEECSSTLDTKVAGFSSQNETEAGRNTVKSSPSTQQLLQNVAPISF